MLKGTLMALAMGLALSASFTANAVTIAGPHANLSCDTCHKGAKMVAPAKETCLTCHQSYEAVAKRTEKLNPNPHFSHRGERECTACHSMHAKPHFECNDCHNFAIKMKGE